MGERRAWLTRADLAAERGVTPGTISTYLYRARTVHAATGRWPATVIPRPSTEAPLAWRAGRKDVTAWLAASRRPQPPGEVVAALYGQGLSCAEVGRRLDPRVPGSTVRDALLRAGVQLRDRDTARAAASRRTA